MEAEHITNGDEAVGAFTVKTTHYIISAIGLVTALSWNTTVKGAIENYFPTNSGETKASIIYSLVMTMILILLIWVLPDTSSELPSNTRAKIDFAEKEKERKILDTQILERKRYLSGLNRSIDNTKPEPKTTDYQFW